MNAKKPAEKLTLGDCGQVASIVADEVAKAVLQVINNTIVKAIKSRRRQLVKRGTNPATLKLWDAVMAGFCQNVILGRKNLFLTLRDSRDLRNLVFDHDELGRLLQEDGFQGGLDYTEGGAVVDIHWS